MIHLVGVSKRYGSHAAVDSVDLSFERGQTHVLIGPSGCGKSTLLRMIVGLVTPDAGEVIFDGQPLNAERLTDVRRRIGYMIQEGGLFPHMTAGENATIMPRFLSWPSDRTKARVDVLAALTHLPPDLLARRPSQLSGGQRQRVSLMRALMLDPDVLLLDEPLGDLDPMIRAELQEELRDIFRKLGKTVVLVTHDLGEAGYLGDNITLLRSGRIVQRGSFADLVHHPAEEFVAKFVKAQRSAVA
jgi:osmoprotectant transport system ATP-binding protein